VAIRRQRQKGIRDRLERQLEQSGYHVTVTPNGVEALAAFKREPFDVVITDYLMPEMDGAGLAQAIRRLTSVEKKSVPIIGLTANAFEDAIASLKSAGIGLVITKPTVKKALDSAIRSALSEPYEEVAEAALPEGGHVIFNAEHCMDLFGNEPRKGVAWLQDFLDHADTAFMEMRECVRTDDHKGLSDRLHTIAGAAAGVGADALSGAARDLSLAMKKGDVDLAQAFEALLATQDQTKKTIDEFIGDLSTRV